MAPLGARAAVALGASIGLSQAAGLPASCQYAAVGGGWAGVYYAFRLAERGATGVCLFEASERIGGRTYSHSFSNLGARNDSFTLDVGAYRFSPDMHLPGDVILKVLQLPVACYEPDCPPANTDFPAPFHFNFSAPLVRIVDIEGMPAGYVTALHGMVDLIKSKGGQVFLGARLQDLIPQPDGSSSLIFEDGSTVSATEVLLNLPRTPLKNLATFRAATPERTTKMQDCIKFDLPEDMFQPGSRMSFGGSLDKAYAFYDDAWWHNTLGKIEGQWPENAFIPMNTSQGIPIGIHFNDGPVRCDAPLKGCRGFLEVFYSAAPQTFFEDLRTDPANPLGVLAAADDSTGRLQKLHEAIMEATKPLFEKAGKAQPTAPPALLAAGIWDRTGKGYTAPTKVYYSTSASTPGGPDPLERACGVPGLSEDEYRKSVLQPVPGAKVLVANNDWVAQKTEDLWGDWAMESLMQAERGLLKFGLPRPQWLDEAFYNKQILAFSQDQVESATVVV